MKSRRAIGPLAALALCVACGSTPEAKPGTSIRAASTDEPAPPRPVVVLMTDFGTRDDAVGLLRGVVLSIARDAAVADLTHEVPSYDVAEGARLLADAPGAFPAGSVFCCVVDPGVGTSRKAIAIKLRNGRFLVGPDNGLLSLAAEKWGAVEAREITDARFMASDVSSTFHGRDVFSPAAAHLATGFPPFAEIGPLLATWKRLEAPPAVIDGDGVKGVVLSIDVPFGNVWTNVTPAVLARIGAKKGDRIAFAFAGRTVDAPWVETFGDVPEGKSLAYVNSRGTLALALNMGDAATTFGAKRGDPVRVSKAK